MGGTRSGDLQPTPRRTHTPRTRHPLALRAVTLLLVLAAAFGLLSALAIIQSADQTAEAALLAEVKKLLASDAEEFDHFGWSVSVSGDIAVVGARYWSAGSGPGAAYIFERDQGGADNWGEVKKLTASDGEPMDQFGYSVGISGNTVVVGAFEHDAGGNNKAGAAYIFERDQGGADNWGEVKKLTASDAQAEDQFGISVAVSGDTALVGAWGEDAGGSGAGAAYVFERNAGGADNWGEVKKLTASDAQNGDIYGTSVAVSGDSAIVGARGEDSGGNLAGAAYVVLRDQGGPDNWGEVKKLTASDAQAEDRFGITVGISGDSAIVGADLEDGVTQHEGAAYIFQRDVGGADNWGEVKKLIASDAALNYHFGASVAIAGDTAFVGGGQVDNNAGNAYVFARNQGGGDNWGEAKMLTASDGEDFDQFGSSVALDGTTAIVAAKHDADAGTLSGSAYIFEEPPPPPTPTPCPTEGCPPTETPTITPTSTDTPTPTNTPTSTPTPTITPTPTDTPTPTITPTPIDGAAMSLSVNGRDGPKVNAETSETFTVTVLADTIPLPTGYVGVQAWVDFGSTGLFPEGNQQLIWPDCDPLFSVVGSSGDAESAGCLSGFASPPASYYSGAVFSFDVTCDGFGGQHTIRLLSLDDPTTLGSGAGYLAAFGTDPIPAEHPGDYIADEIVVNCVHGSPGPSDLDGDGCLNSAEQQVAPGSETTGGLRDYLNFWDFYDVAIAGAVQGQDQQIDLFNDIVSVIDHYAPVGTEPEYDAFFDRGPSAGPNSWNMTAPDGKIDLFNDIVGVIAQFGHDCR